MCGNEQRVAAQVTEFRLAANVDHIQAEGYTIIEAPAPADFVERLRAAILRRKETDGVLNYLIGKDAIFEDALLNPKLQAFAEAVCGPNPLLFQLAATSRPQGDEAIPTHAGQRDPADAASAVGVDRHPVLDLRRVHRSRRLHEGHPGVPHPSTAADARGGRAGAGRHSRRVREGFRRLLDRLHLARATTPAPCRATGLRCTSRCAGPTSSPWRTTGTSTKVGSTGSPKSCAAC